MEGSDKEFCVFVLTLNNLPLMLVSHWILVSLQHKSILIRMAKTLECMRDYNNTWCICVSAVALLMTTKPMS